LGHAPFEIRRGERIAQLVVHPVARAELIEADEVSGTERGNGGFGSTGKSAPGKRAANGPAKKKRPEARAAVAKRRSPSADVRKR
jgi:dUTP pyrophosphatase